MLLVPVARRDKRHKHESVRLLIVVVMQTIKSRLYAKIQHVHSGRWDEEENVSADQTPSLDCLTPASD